jgi:hypothetical protein
MRAPVDLDLRVPGRGEQPYSGRAEEISCPQHDVACCDFLPTVPDVLARLRLARRNATREPVPPSPVTGLVNSTITTASAPAGTGAPVMILAAWPGPTSPSHQSPAAMCATTSSSGGTVGARTGGVGEAQGEAVHRRVVERCHIDVAGGIGREHAPERVEERDPLGFERRDARKDEIARLLDGHRRWFGGAGRCGAGCGFRVSHPARPLSPRRRVCVPGACRRRACRRARNPPA